MLRLDKMSLVKSLLWLMLTNNDFFLLSFLLWHDFAPNFLDEAARHLRCLSSTANSLPSRENAVFFFTNLSVCVLLVLCPSVLNKKKSIGENTEETYEDNLSFHVNLVYWIVDSLEVDQVNLRRCHFMSSFHG